VRSREIGVHQGLPALLRETRLSVDVGGVRGDQIFGDGPHGLAQFFVEVAGTEEVEVTHDCEPTPARGRR
jgi:hypothetical protein